MNIQLTVRAAGAGISWKCHEWTVLVALGSLAAEPETLSEFFGAVRRYQPDHHWDETGQPADNEAAITGDGNWCLIDLAARCVVAGDEFELPEVPGAFQAESDDDLAGGFHIVWIDALPGWLFQSAADDWQSAISQRRQALAGRRRVESRAVLFGRPMLEFAAARVLAGAVVEAHQVQRYEQIREIHADWLMTVRDDLLGHSPRELLLSRREQIDWDIQRRSQQWSTQGFAPPPLDADSAAYRFGGYGTAEIVLYFDLVRSLLSEAWRQVVAGESNCEILVERLVAHRDWWLDQPPEDSSGGPTCKELIESERRRTPITDDGSHLDCDCPICQAEADGAFGSGPTFMFYDGHHLELEDEFAFSIIESREEWEREQAAFRCYDEALDRQRAERGATDDQPDSVWTSSSVDWDNILNGGESLLPAKLAIGFPLGELVNRLQQRDADRANINALNAAFTTFRRADDRVAEQSAAEELRMCLEDVANAYPELVAQSADLQSRLDEVLRSAGP